MLTLRRRSERAGSSHAIAPGGSLRRRALRPFIALGLLVALAGMVAVRQLADRQLATRVSARGNMVAHVAARAIEVAPDVDGVRHIVRSISTDRELPLILVTAGAPPRVIASTRREWQDRFVGDIGQPGIERVVLAVSALGADRRERMDARDQFTFCTPAHFGTSARTAPGATVFLRLDASRIHAEVNRWALETVGLLLAMLLTAIVTAEFVLRRYVLKPIAAMAAAAERRRAGEATVGPEVFADDELGQLARTLAAADREADDALRRLRHQVFALDQAATVSVTDARGVILAVNDRFCAVSGYAREELIGRTHAVVSSGAHPPGYFAAMWACIGTGQVWHHEVCNRRKDGTLYWLDATIIPSLDENGRVERFTGAFHDITARKQSEDALRAAEHRFRTVTNAAPALIWMTGPDAQTTFLNDGWLRFTGRTMAEEAGDGWVSGIHPDDREPFFAKTSPMFEAHTPFEAEYRLRRHDGEYRLMLDQAVPMFDGDRFNGFIGTCVDITERKAAEERLRESEARTRQIVDTSLDAVITIDGESRITGWNAQAEQVFGWSAAEVIGQSLTETIVPQQFRRAHTRGMERYMSTGAGPVLGQRMEMSAVRRGGEEFPIEIAISPLARTEGRSFSAFVRDISERKRVETELVQAKEAAQGASRAKSEFLATMSHEIRTPMNGVIGFTDLLMDTGLDATQREYAETIRESGKALLSLINDILDFSKIEAGKLDVEHEPYDARIAAGDVIELLANKSEERGIELVFDCRDSRLPLVGDAMRFRQVLLNLVGNAIKFTASGAVFVGMERTPEGRLLVSVKDTGIGIARDKLARLFQKFTQADSSTTRRFGGSGLGLAISKQLVELMGGQIGAESSPGQGSRFWFSLPLPTQPVEVAAPPDLDAVRGMRVLVVDDLETNRRVLAAQVAPWGVEVETAEGATTALAALHAAKQAGRPFDAALLDMHMPGMDGEALGRAILADRDCGAPALVLLSSGSFRTETAHFRALGFAEVLLKPIVRIEHLHEALAHIAATRGRRAGSAVVPAPRAPQASVGTVDFAGRRVLLAEDQPVNQKLAVRVLTRAGCRVDVALDGIEACAMSAATDYALVLMDCHMPDMDGYEATREIRAREAAQRAAGGPERHVPIVALTASVLQVDRDRCFASGMDDFISKPFRPEELHAALRRWTSAADGSEGPLREAA